MEWPKKLYTTNDCGDLVEMGFQGDWGKHAAYEKSALDIVVSYHEIGIVFFTTPLEALKDGEKHLQKCIDDVRANIEKIEQEQ